MLWPSEVAKAFFTSLIRTTPYRIIQLRQKVAILAKDYLAWTAYNPLKHTMGRTSHCTPTMDGWHIYLIWAHPYQMSSLYNTTLLHKDSHQLERYRRKRAPPTPPLALQIEPAAPPVSWCLPLQPQLRCRQPAR